MTVKKYWRVLPRKKDELVFLTGYVRRVFVFTSPLSELTEGIFVGEEIHFYDCNRVLARKLAVTQDESGEVREVYVFFQRPTHCGMKPADSCTITPASLSLVT